MGVEFHPNKHLELTLAPQLQEKCTTILNKLKTFKDHNVPRDMILNFITTILVPTVNYGPFIDPIQTVDEYKEIDD